MLADLAKSRRVLITVGTLTVLFTGFIVLQRGQPLALSRSGNQFGAEDALSGMRQTLAKDRSLLATYEQEQAKLRAEVIKRRKLLQDGQIAKEQVQKAEQAFVAALKRVHQMRHAVIETDIAITEAVLGEKVDRLPVLPVNGYSETKELTRFNGGHKWSLKEAPRLEKYFAQKFGRRLPITALGQSVTHNRLRFDHRDSMDVALHPDSVEGKALIDHLRKTGVPFIAFRGAVAGASTGPHIHIGKASSRLAS
jgi:hypothetical protein